MDPQPAPYNVDLARSTQGATRSYLFLAQFLSSWAIRSSESGQALFLAAAFPGTLWYISLYSLARSLAAVLFSSWVGSYADSVNRLKALHLSIAFHRCSVALSCVVFLLLQVWSVSASAKYVFFVALSVLGCFEKLASIASIVAIERDWVIIFAETYGLARLDLNASLRMLDLLSRLISPVIVSALDTWSPWVALWVVMTTNAASVLVEFGVTRRLYESIPNLAWREPTTKTHYQGNGMAMQDLTDPLSSPTSSVASSPTRVTFQSNHASRTFAPWKDYIYSPVFLASFSNAILYWTVLTFGGQMTTYLLATGFAPIEISFLRVGAVLAELGGTLIAPTVMARIGPVRSGLWFLMWQVLCVGAFAGGIFSQQSMTRSTSILLSAGITLKRLGLWGSDLAIQFIVQEARSRCGSFNTLLC